MAPESGVKGVPRDGLEVPDTAQVIIPVLVLIASPGLPLLDA